MAAKANRKKTAKLSEYERKRDFGATPEPAAKKRRRKKGAPRFVVQEHSARRLHWDLRLEHDGTAVSWAIPNGIPSDPSENRKAVHTEDHPLEYLDFEGEIPAGEYGAGTMKIWDKGTYECHKWVEGKIIFSFAGERLSGRYALFRAGSEKDWMIHRIDPPSEARDPFPESVVPMLARLAELPANDEKWAVEVKWDGVRAIAYCRPGRLELQSRNLRDITAQYPEVRRLSRQLGAREAILDGELVAFDEEGRPSFERLQQRIHQTAESVVRRRMKTHPVVYAIFDLLHLDGRNLFDEPYTRRRELLEQLGLSGQSWQTPGYAAGRAKELLEASAKQGLEGVVLKRLDSGYAPGKRTGSWLKVKNTARQELVIGGWVPGEGRRRDRIGALLMGYFEPDGGKLRYAGKVGTGFSEQDLTALARRLAPLERKTSPFKAGKAPQKGARFVKPELVAEIEFRELTAEGMVRHGSFKGLRGDKASTEVGLERSEPIDWYTRVAGVLLPHLRDRPLRVHGKGDHRLANDLPALIRIVSRGEIELHASLSLAADIEHPTAMAFELEPGSRTEIAECAQVAIWIKGMLEQLELCSHPKTSGSGGLQLFVALDSAATYAQTRRFAKAVAETLESKFPERVASRKAKSRHDHRVLIDWSRNDPDETTVCPYSLRAGKRATVSTPLEWEEVEAVLADGDGDRLAFDPAAVLARVEEKGDLFAPLLSERQSLPT